MNRYLLKKFSTAIVFILFYHGTYAQMPPALASSLQQTLNDRVQFYGNNGVSACVIMPDGSVWKGVAGVGQNSVAITDSTVFHAASITKTNIATLLLLLQEDGLLNLDSSWKKYINLNVAFNPSITLRQLLNHTSGIKDYLETVATQSYVTTNFNYSYTPVEILENIVSSTPDFAPGTNFNYSSSNYALAALIAQTVTGNPVEQELRNRLWNPLNMNHTYFGATETYTEPRAGVWWNFGNGMQNYSNNPELSMLSYGYGGANLVSTPENLAKFARALFTGTVLTANSMNQMKVFHPNSTNTWKGYGLGIHRPNAFGNTSTFGHDGYYTNMSDMFHSLDYGFTLVTMTNTQTGWFGIFNDLFNKIKNHIVSVRENEPSAFIHLFPNPPTNLLSVDLGISRKYVEVSIVDVTGKLVYKNSMWETQKLEVDTRDFFEGIYILKVQADDFTGTKKLIVTK